MEIIFILLIVGLFIFCIYCLIKSFELKQNKQIEYQEKENTGKEKYDAKYTLILKHVCGLPLAENTECTIYLAKDKIVIDAFNNIYTLDISKILDISMKNSKEIKNSISGAVGGALLFGPIGALIGGSKNEFHRFFIIIYKDKDFEQKCISFDMNNTSKEIRDIYNYIQEFKIIKSKDKQKIEL